MYTKNSLSKISYIPCLIVLIFMVCSNIVAQEKESANTIIVTATGIGHNTDEALKDAFKNAVRRAVGVYVLTETTMNSNEEIDEKVYANADATINSHTIIDTKTLPNNLVKVTIKAEVLKGVIGQKINKGKTTEVNKTDIVNVTNHLDAMEEAQKSLDLLFKDFPACLLKVEAIGQPYINDTEDITQDVIPMLQKIHIYIDYRKYQQFVEKLTSLFNQLGYKKGKKIGLTNESYITLQKDGFNNCFCIVTRKNPNMLPQQIQDLNCQIYRLPGQIMRYMQVYKKREIILFYELSDIDNNILSKRELVNSFPFIFDSGQGLEFCDSYEGKGFFSISEGGGYYQKPFVAILSPLHNYNGWFHERYRRNLRANYVNMSLRIQVNRQLHKNALKLKINVSIQNKEDDNLEIP